MDLIGYARVSTDGQNEARQLEAFKDLGVEKIFIDRCARSLDLRTSAEKKYV